MPKLCVSDPVYKPHALTPPKTVLWNTVAVECQGDGDLLNNLRVKNTLTGQESDLPVKGLFYAIGERRTSDVYHDECVTSDQSQVTSQQLHLFAINYKPTQMDT
jgi:thioredoxin reductase